MEIYVKLRFFKLMEIYNQSKQDEIKLLHNTLDILLLSLCSEGVNIIYLLLSL